MSIIHSIIFGIVEGLTEFLPISSTAHLEITQNILGIANSDFIKSFEIAIQLGAILAVLFIYRGKLFSSWVYVRNILIAFIPTGVIGFVLYKVIKSFLLGNVNLAAWTLLLGGIIIIFYEWRGGNNIGNATATSIEEMPTKELLILGAIQAIAVVPGVSRSGAVIVGGRMMGLPKNLITEFSFLLAIPTIFAATVYDLLKSGFAFGSGEWGALSVGFLVAFLVALLTVKWFLGYVKTHSFSIFGWYRVAIGLCILGLHI